MICLYLVQFIKKQPALKSKQPTHRTTDRTTDRPTDRTTMSCSPEVVSWMNECYDEAAASLAAEAREAEEHVQGWMSFKKEIKDTSEKTTFRGQHRPEARYTNPDSRHGYEISIVTSAFSFLKKTKDFPAMSWSSAILCDYDPKRDNIMFEVSSTERGYSCHTMKMSKFESLVAGNQITLKKM